LEAISQKAPVILSDNETFREIFSGYQQYLFEMGNHRSLASKIIEFIQTGAKSKIVIEQSEILFFYSPMRMSSAIEQIYEETIK
jgi:glycosyltransferase involved in cell wall biosynthesis